MGEGERMFTAKGMRADKGKESWGQGWPAEGLKRKGAWRGEQEYFFLVPLLGFVDVPNFSLSL